MVTVYSSEAGVGEMLLTVLCPPTVHIPLFFLDIVEIERDLPLMGVISISNAPSL